MNVMVPPIPLIPENAPFSAAQRAWLNGFLAGLYGGATATGAAAPAPEPEDFPWHDPALELTERMQLAEARPLRQRLMAAMGQLDCGQCGYLCQSYADALAEGREGATSLCVPGGKPTSRLLKQLLAEAPAPTVTPAQVAVPPRPSGRPVRIVSAAALTRPGSSKDVRHVVIDLAESGLAYEPGDSIGLATPNDPALVAATLAALDLSGDEMVAGPDGASRTVLDAFSHALDIARPLDRTTDLLAMSAKHPRHADALRKLSDGADGAEPVDADLLDLLEAFPSARPSLADLVQSLPALRPRLYSIASSPRAAPGQVHLCVAVVRDTRRNRVRNGVGSGFLADRAASSGPVEAYIQSSHFRLPADPAVPVIMVGPGTGIAPFRAFLAERAVAGIRGRTWLLFGDRNGATDFLYEDELTAWRKDGTLGRLDTAFSRDQGRKVYVQDRMMENAEDLWRWLQNGAYFYVCGDAMRMAKDVDAALRKIALTEGRLNESQARDWIVALARQGRYLRDVYMMRHFPLFMDLSGRAVLVLGAGEVAERKAEPLRRAGAVVRMRAVFDAADLDGCALAVGADAPEAELVALAQVARGRGIPVNVVDRPDLCSFIMPAVVDRDPVTIAISTGGNAPVLARLLRARIETVVPPAFGRLAALAGRFSAEVRRRIGDLGARRRVLERVLTGRVAALVFSGDEAGAAVALEAELTDVARPQGMVFLVGAGPGAADLLTLRAHRLLGEADVIVHDRLVSDEVLEMARRDAERIFVGKARARHCMKQADINALLVRLARAGKRVVRLKGGDPLVFGRGGEEAEALAAAGVDFEIVPGITAALACAADAGIALTHRDASRAVTLVTGHTTDGSLELDFAALARRGGTVAVYMGIHTLAQLAEGLDRHGFDPMTPAALIERGGTRRARVLRATLPALVARAPGWTTGGPTLLLLGEVVGRGRSARDMAGVVAADCGFAAGS